MTIGEAYIICLALSVIDQGTTTNVRWMVRGKPSPQELLAKLSHEFGIDLCSDQFSEHLAEACEDILAEAKEAEL